MSATKAPLIALLMALFLLSSCISPPSNAPPDAARWYRGTNGVLAGFLNDAPPPVVYEDTPVPVQVYLHDAGAIDVPFKDLEEDILPRPGVITLNWDPFYFTEGAGYKDAVADDDNIILQGSSDTMPGGEEYVDSFPLYAKKVLGQRESPSTQLFVNFCYPYQTVFQSEVCMDSNTQRRNLRDQVCTSRDLAFTGGQGAPVEVTKVEVDMIPVGANGYLTRPRFVFHVRNSGAGSVVRAITPENDDQQLCDTKGKRTSLGTIHPIAYVAGVKLECSPDPFRLAYETAKFFCVAPERALEEHPEIFARQDNYITSLNLKMYYTYSVGASREVEIERFFQDDFDKDIQDYTGMCLPWQKDDDGKCVTACGAEYGKEYSCSCSLRECAELPEGRCSPKPDLCPPTGEVCCKKFACEDFTDISACNEQKDCTYCKETKSCISTDKEQDLCAGEDDDI